MPCNDIEGQGSPAVCEVGGGGLFFPLFGDDENEWDNGFRIPLYLFGLLYCFLGVAIIADVFMGAIEKITSEKKFVFDPRLNKKRTKYVWNPTVANLTLMALGSSAPEILLNVIGIFSASFKSGDLGPSTIVGSAAFNMLCIIAVVIVSVPKGDIRKIKDMGVFACTAFFSVFAYIWLLIMLMVISPDIIEVWEGIVTFALFWVLIVIAYLADVGLLPFTHSEPGSETVFKESSKEEISAMEYKVRQKYGGVRNLTPDQVKSLIDYEYNSPHSRAAHRVNATRSMCGGKKVLAAESNYEKGARLAKEFAKLCDTFQTQQRQHTVPCVSFKALNYTCLESDGVVNIEVVCTGSAPQKPFIVYYAPRDGTAKRGSDYDIGNIDDPQGQIEFGPGHLEAKIPVSIVHSKNKWEATEEFYLDLVKAEDQPQDYVIDGHKSVTIVIIDEDQPGIIAFTQECEEIMESAEKSEVEIEVVRKRGASGDITCDYATEDSSARAGSDYDAASGTLSFSAGQTSASFKVIIHPKGRYEGDEMFRVVLTNPTNGASFDCTTDGGKEKAIMTILIKANKEGRSRIDNLFQAFHVNMDSIAAGNASYRDQFVSALFVNGGPDEQKNAGVLDWVTHILALPWKFVFAFVPPTEYAGGWISFCIALTMIGIVTIMIGDLAELLGCVADIKPSTTAITLVALGTSLPDLFASRTAARMDPFADNSIGNVTGSNSVNVFLGLGLPWMIAAFYWQFVAECEAGDTWSVLYPKIAKDFPTGRFVVLSGSLGTSVATFSVCAVLCIGTLLLRRNMLGGELGGPDTLNGQLFLWGSAGFFVALWMVYIVVSIVSD